MQIDPIGYFQSVNSENYEVPFQTGLIEGFSGIVSLNKGHNFETALTDLKDFDRIWLIFHFHKSKENWKPMVNPPRGQIKRGIFATRSLHRPS